MSECKKLPNLQEFLLKPHATSCMPNAKPHQHIRPPTVPADTAAYERYRERVRTESPLLFSHSQGKKPEITPTYVFPKTLQRAISLVHLDSRCMASDIDALLFLAHAFCGEILAL